MVGQERRLAAGVGDCDGRDQARLIKLSMDASTCGLRYWRSLKFSDGGRRAWVVHRRPLVAPRKAAYLHQAGDDARRRRWPHHERPLSPAVRFYCCMGTWPPLPTTGPHRVHGWVEWRRSGPAMDHAMRRAADRVRDELDRGGRGIRLSSLVCVWPSAEGFWSQSLVPGLSG